MRDQHRDECRRLHRIVGQYLATHAWVKKLDCIVVTKTGLRSLLGLEKFKRERVKWLREDLEPWFTHQVVFWAAGSSTIHSLYLSRVPIDDSVSKGTMTTDKRIRAMKAQGLRTGLLWKAGDRHPSPLALSTYNILLAAGLRRP